MADSFFPFSNPFDFQDYDMELKTKQNRSLAMDFELPEDMAENDLLLSDFNFSSFLQPPTPSIDHETISKLKEIQTSCQDQHVKPIKNVKSNPSASSSLEILSNYYSTRGFRKMKGVTVSSSQTTGQKETNAENSKKLSTDEIIRVAGTRYIQFFDQISNDDFSMDTHPYGCALSGLSEEETKDVELVHLLLAAAEKVSYQQFERASRLLSRCEWIAADKSNPVQRIVFYFAAALRKRIDIETGRIGSKEPNAGISRTDNGLDTNLTFLTCYQNLPFNQVLFFTAIQTIVENSATASKLHLIDFEIRSGVQWTALMQSLAERGNHRPFQLLKITAVGFDNNKEKLEQTGKSLSSFAESLNLPFSFKIVSVSCMLEIKKELFEIQNDETVVVYCALILRSMIVHLNVLENLMEAIRNLNPSLVLVIEVEANHNSPSFVNRFIEALFYYAALFDSLEMCMAEQKETRTVVEEILKNGIRNIVAMEGVDRRVRSVNIEVWRTFFSRYGMEEIGLSESCMYQASLVVQQFRCRNYCTLDRNEKSLIVGWKGTPIHSFSAWKFSKGRGRSFLSLVRS